MYYSVTIGYEQENNKVKKVKYLCEAESIEEASLVMSQYAGESMDNAKVMSIVEDKTSEVIDVSTSPKYYKKVKVTA